MQSSKILIVDDEMVIARELEARLSTLGYEVSGIAGTAEEAIELAREARPHLVLMDIVLRGESDGIDAAREILKSQEVPLVYLTAYADDHTLSRARMTKPYGFIVKPFSERELKASIEMALHKHQSDLHAKHFDEQLHQLQKLEALGQLAGGVAHDFNNLLTIILSYTELLSQEQSVPGTQKVMLQSIHDAGQRAKHLTGKLLAFSRKQPLRPEVCNLNAILTETLAMLERLIPESISLHFFPEPKLQSVMVDAFQFEEVLINLAINARDAMPGGGRIKIKTKNVEIAEDDAQAPFRLEPGHYVTLTVADTGCGMDAETQARIFEPFFTTKKPGQGTGLGLAIVYGIVKQSGGDIQIQSQVGQGTTFQIYLPALSVSATPPKPLPKPKKFAPHRATVLLVEDEQQVRDIVQKTLEGYGYRVLTACSGEEGLRTARQHPGPIHLVVTDIVMPGMNGPQMAEQIQATNPDAQVLFMSGYPSFELYPKNLIAPDQKFLQKPFGPSDIVSMVREVVGPDSEASQAAS